MLSCYPFLIYVSWKNKPECLQHIFLQVFITPGCLEDFGGIVNVLKFCQEKKKKKLNFGFQID